MALTPEERRERREAGYRQEKVVAILERHVDQRAHVRQNKFLPVIPEFQGSREPRNNRQIDVLIEKPTPSGLVRTIVEVQKRQERVGIDTFNAWHEKMREVGAQNLLCISEAGFVSSVLDKADNIGPSVRLYTLDELDHADFIPGTTFSQEMLVAKYVQLVRMQMEGEHLMRSDPNRDPNEKPSLTDKIFKFPPDKVVAAEDVLDWHFFANPQNISELPLDQQVGVQAHHEWDVGKGILYRDFGGNWVPLAKFDAWVQVIVTEVQISWTASEYADFDAEAGDWAVSGKADVGGTIFDIVQPLKRVDSGVYSAGRPVVLGDFAAFMMINGTVYRAEQFDPDPPPPTEN